jgi:DNA-binding MarR family transcriptional regulator
VPCGYSFESDRLSRQGLVERRRDGRDRRSVVGELRPAGEAVLRKLAVYSIAELKTEVAALFWTKNRPALSGWTAPS